MKEFKKGYIDAAEFSIPQWDLFLGLKKVAKYNYYPGWIQPTTIFELIINKNKWDGISKVAQTIISTACESLLLRSNIKFNAMQSEAMEELEKQGAIFVNWKDSELNLFKKAWFEVIGVRWLDEGQNQNLVPLFFSSTKSAKSRKWRFP